MGMAAERVSLPCSCDKGCSSVPLSEGFWELLSRSMSSTMHTSPITSGFGGCRFEPGNAATGGVGRRGDEWGWGGGRSQGQVQIHPSSEPLNVYSMMGELTRIRENASSRQQCLRPAPLFPYRK